MKVKLTYEVEMDDKEYDDFILMTDEQIVDYMMSVARTDLPRITPVLVYEEMTRR